MSLDLFCVRLSTTGETVEGVNPFTREPITKPAPDPLSDEAFAKLAGVLGPLGFKQQGDELICNQEGWTGAIARAEGDFSFYQEPSEEAHRALAAVVEAGFFVMGPGLETRHSNEPVSEQLRFAWAGHSEYADSLEDELGLND